MGEVIALIAVGGGLLIPIIAILSVHQRKVLEMKLQLRNQSDTGLQGEIEALRQEVRALRDTSTQYDLSFDTALQRMEQRVERIERRDQIMHAEQNVQLGNLR